MTRLGAPVALALILGACTILLGEWSGKRPANGALPLPPGITVAAVLDPDVYQDGIDARGAVKIARMQEPMLVGRSPLVQLVRIASPTDPQLDGFVGWIVLSTDIEGFRSGPYLPNLPNLTPPPLVATYSYVFVSVDGLIVSRVQLMYEAGDEVPPLP